MQPFAAQRSIRKVVLNVSQEGFSGAGLSISEAQQYEDQTTGGESDALRMEKAGPHHTDRPLRGLRRGLARSSLERLATTAILTRVGIGDFESAPREGITEINHRTFDVILAESIYHNCHAVLIGEDIPVALLVKHHAVLHA